MHQQVAYCGGVVWCTLSWHTCNEIHDQKCRSEWMNNETKKWSAVITWTVMLCPWWSRCTSTVGLNDACRYLQLYSILFMHARLRGFTYIYNYIIYIYILYICIHILIYTYIVSVIQYLEYNVNVISVTWDHAPLTLLFLWQPWLSFHDNQGPCDHVPSPN